MKRIPLTQGQFTIVDDEDYTELIKYKWCAHKARNIWYALRHTSTSEDPDRKQHTVRMHRQILGLPLGQLPEVDHIDRDGLNNQRHNLRVASTSQNCANKQVYRNSKSGYKGVYFIKNRNRWEAEIRVKKKLLYLGLFENLRDAVEAYNAAALKYFGQFAKLNEVPKSGG